MYAIVDIETTGGSARIEKITEIAVYKHDGEKITSEFVTLINPERNIPYFITNLTGITNEMVEDAPRFHEIARLLIEFTEGRILVAHNARFDYSFIRQEFKSLGYNFKRSILDTVALCRKLFPGHRSYSLGNRGRLIYIGKSRNLLQRISTHLSNNTTNRSMEMRDTIADIGWEVTGSELIALLRESYEIKDNKPVYNRAWRRTGFQWGICKGACCGKESPGEYNERAEKALEEFVFVQRNFLIIDKGRDEEERCAVKIVNGKYAGYGYFNISDMGFGLTAVHECIKPSADNRDIQVILKSYLRRNRVEKIIEF